MSANEKASRITSERERLGLTVAQFAVLLGVSEKQQSTIEAGDFSSCPSFYEHAIQRVGGDPLFIHGQKSEPAMHREDLLFGDDAFMAAVSLLRKSQQAVDAFLGEGTSTTSPSLVAALMNATLQERNAIGAGDLESLASTIANAIEAAGSQIAEALLPDDED